MDTLGVRSEKAGNVTKEDKACEKIDILGDTIENCGVYLFPFIIEFSMIGAHIVYNMWKNVGNKPKFAMVGEDDNTQNKGEYFERKL